MKTAPYKPSPMVAKLIMLYVLEKMDIPLTEYSILEIVTSSNDWLNYMDAKVILLDLVDVGFVKFMGEGRERKYSLTHDGRSCLSYYFQRIPATLREEILEYSKKSRATLKRNQEYLSDFYKVTDGEYMINLKIKDSASYEPMLEINLKTNSRQQAIIVYKKWKAVAPQIYEMLISNLFEE
ncbi:MAG: DUF4364 family protein [Firmicutes bacterium]|nr:DUF4364 family protein [Bacillota bacterium]MCL2771027.1 DUF4364 family protein [Bacillota bacterium]